MKAKMATLTRVVVPGVNLSLTFSGMVTQIHLSRVLYEVITLVILKILLTK